MKRTFNFTGRQKIRKADLEFQVDEWTDGNTFQVNRFEYDNLSIPEDTELIIEAYVKGVYVERLELGSVTQFTSGQEFEISDEIDPYQLMFRVKIVNAEGRILCFAEQIKPVNAEREGDEGSRDSILPVIFTEDLNQEFWRLDFGETEIKLELNKNITDIQDIARHSPNFSGLVFPQVVREILSQIMITEQNGPGVLENDGSWRGDWFQFALNLYGSEPDVDESMDSVTKNRIIQEWIDEVVRTFARENRFLDKLEVKTKS